MNLKTIFYKLVALSILVGFSIWYGNDPGPEPLIGIISTFGAILGPDFLRKSKLLNAQDNLLLGEFKDAITAMPEAIKLLKQQDFNNAFWNRDYDPIIVFEEKWRHPHPKFRNLTLRRALNHFLASIRSLDKLKKRYTGQSEHNPGMSKIDPSVSGKRNLTSIAWKINNQARAVYAAYSTLITLSNTFGTETEQSQ